MEVSKYINPNIIQDRSIDGNKKIKEYPPLSKGSYDRSVEQESCWAAAQYSHAEGYHTKADGYAAHAEGTDTITFNQGEHTEGRYNLSIEDKTIHTVGIGVTTRRNAHEIHLDGKHYVYGIGGYDGTNSQTEGIKTVQEVVEEATNAVQITYAELKFLRDAGKLVPGTQYRITDYTCTTTQTNTKSAGHVFDIIVTADDENTLNEVARATLHTGDTYFANSNLSAWKIWYCLDNDTNRFAWANGDRLIDTIKPTGSSYTKTDTYTYSSPISKIVFLGKAYNLKIGERTWLYAGPNVYATKTDDYTLVVEGLYDYFDTGISVYTEGKGVIYRMIDEWNNDVPYDFKNIQYNGSWGYWAYTFNWINDGGDNSCEDLSVAQYAHTNDEGGYSHTYGNVIKPCEDASSTDYGYPLKLNACVFLNTESFEGGLYYGCYSNSFGNGCHSNSFGNGCNSNSFGSYCSCNSFGNNCDFNSFGNNCEFNFFENSCAYNSFEIYCISNSFGRHCNNNSFGNDCRSNSFGNDCYYNSFGNDCCYIKFSASKLTSSTKYNYYKYNHFGDGCQYILFKGADTASPSNQVQNYNFSQGLQGTDGAYITIDGVRNLSYEVKVAKNSKGEIKIYCEADLIA